MDADLVDDSTSVNKFVTQAQINQIGTNTQDIADIEIDIENINNDIGNIETDIDSIEKIKKFYYSTTASCGTGKNCREVGADTSAY